MRTLTFLSAIVLSTGVVSGCTSFKPSPLSPRQAIEGQKFVRLTVIEPPDSEFAETIMLKNPWASDVAIGGEVCTKNTARSIASAALFWFLTPEYSCRGNRIVPLGSIHEVEARSYDPLKTGLLAASIAGGFGMLLLIYAAGSR